MSRPRLIPIVTLIENKAVKTKKFKDPRYVGDPINTVALLSSYEVEELIVLDISRGFGQPETPFSVLEQIVENAFMPIAFGGGIQNMAQAKKIFSIGFDKIIVRSSLLESNLALTIAREYGAQAVTGCLDVEYVGSNDEFMIVNGRRYNTVECNKLISELANLGMGELVIQDVLRDGTRQDFRSHPLLTAAINILEIPIIPVGGGNDVGSAAKFLRSSGCHSIGASTMFLFRPTRDAILITYPDVEEWHELTERKCT
jgi:cyclase